MTLEIEAVARAIGAAGKSPAGKASGWSVDTRTQNPGDVYFALRGPNHDGHDFVAAALEKRAAAVVVEAPPIRAATVPRASRARERSPLLRSQYPGGLPVERAAGVAGDLPEERSAGVAGDLLGMERAAGVAVELVVPDTQRALQELGAWARMQWGGTVIGVTGSAGKTTTKDAIAQLLASTMTVGKTEGNFNNHVGVPLSLLRLADDCRAGVIEMGMNHSGELRQLAAIAKPEIGVVTNVGYAHVEFFDSIDDIALAKRELIEGLTPDGVAVLNADDVRVARFARVHPGRSLTFGLGEGADVRAENVIAGANGTRFRALGVDFETRLSGRHAVMNLLAAIAVATVFEIAPSRLRDAVAGFAAGKMRGERTEHNGIVIWNDCYNSNPEAAQSMIDVLRDTPAARRIAVLGEMLELGHAAEELHAQVGRYAAAHGVDVLIGVHGAARAMVEAASRAGLEARFFADPAEAGERARELARPGDAVLFKGSRGVKVEKALERFKA